MKVLVTGAKGLLGSNVVRTLLSQGYDDISVLLRNDKDPTPTLDGLKLTRYYGDICVPESLDEAFQGMDYVIHCAGKTGLNPARGIEYWRVNRDGTMNVVEAVLKHKVKRLIHVGTANSFGAGSPRNPGTEMSTYNNQNGFDYVNAKRQAQEMILEAVDKRGLPAVIVNPTMMIGPYDSRPSSGVLILALYQRRIPACSPGGRNYVGVKDAAVATVNALTMGQIGECYILADENLSFREAYNRISHVIGVRAPRINLPAIFVKAFGWANSLLSKVFGYTPNITKEIAAVSCHHAYYSGEKAHRELKMPFTPFEEAVEECYAWFETHGMLD